MTKRASLTLTVADPGGRLRTYQGREAWALRELIRAGERGCTPIDHPGPRWSAYVFQLRRDGLVIETRHESHGGPFPGNHARYILRTPLRIIEREAA
jgi:hypothetical protein